MKKVTRVLTSGVAASVAAVFVGAAPASAATVGKGMTKTTTSVLTFSIGSGSSQLLNVGLLTDTGSANIDSHSGTPQATVSLVPLTLASPALHLNVSTPAITVLSPGGQSNAASQAITLSSLGVPAALATGTIKPAALHSDFTSTAAHSTMAAAEVDNLTLAGGGLASIDLLSSSLGADALQASADGARGVNIGTIKILDLGALLKGIGTDLSALPVGTLSALLQQLGVPVQGLAVGTSLSGEVANLNTVLTGLRQALVGATTQITTPVDSATSGLLGGLGLPVPTVGATVSTVNNEIASVQSTLTGLLTSALAGLDSFPLVQVDATNIGINTKAADTVANSAASVNTGNLVLKVAGHQLALNPAAAVNTVNGVIASANGALNGLLTTLGLPANLVSLSLLDKATSVGQSNGYTTAAAGLTVLTAKVAAINPAAVLGAINGLAGPAVSTLLGGTSLGSVIPVDTAMGGLNTLLGQAAPLLNGAQLQIASLAGASVYTFTTPTSAPNIVPPPLPHTGGNPALALLGVLFAALAIGAIRWSRVHRLATVPSQD